nr:MAG TPA: hypothetical protein [Caudoviricetes sp.]
MFVLLHCYNSYINMPMGFFISIREVIFKKNIYRQAVSVYYRPLAIMSCSKLGYMLAFFILTNFTTCYNSVKII